MQPNYREPGTKLLQLALFISSEIANEMAENEGHMGRTSDSHSSNVLCEEKPNPFRRGSVPADSSEETSQNDDPSETCYICLWCQCAPVEVLLKIFEEVLWGGSTNAVTRGRELLVLVR